MLIKISGGSDGIKEYLENGQKQGRDFTRDELDERVILAGDLAATDSVIQSIDRDGERYLHITLAFKEDEIDRATLEGIARDFQEFAFSAHQADEYSFYAEAHLPRIKSYTHEQTGEFVERKPHIHIVVPKTNLVSGEHLNPFGMVEKNEKFIDAFQEHINAKYGLASPKDNRRVEFTGESEMISRYKGDLFDGKNTAMRAEILEAMLARKVERYADFRDMLGEFGEVRTRNEGKAAEYQNVKAEGQAKGVNLKDYVFSREFVELPDAEKRRHLAGEIQRKYETAGPQRKTPQELADTLREWREFRAKEVKHINSGNRRLYAEYKAADPDKRRAILAEREARFNTKHRKIQHAQRDAAGPGGRDAGRFGRSYGFKREPGAERERAAGDGRRAGRAAPHRKPDPFAAPERTPPQTLNRVRSLSGVGVVRFAQGSEVLLQGDAPHQLEHGGTERADALRRPGAGERGRVRATGRDADNVPSQLSRDHQEAKKARGSERQSEFQEIKQRLDARRLLAELSQSHGVIPEKYEVTKGKDGGDRIKCGTRNLNVSDFLTRELNMNWNDAAKTLRDSYARQQGREPGREHRQEPRRQLWAEFQEHRKTAGQQQRAAQWDDQRQRERARREAIKAEFYAKRSKAQSDRRLKPAERKAAVSIARMERVTREEALRERIKAERERMKAEQSRPAREQYRDFLTGKAKEGDEQALAELRRMRPAPAEPERATDAQVKPAERQAEQVHAPIHRAPAITYQVDRNGDVTYQRDGRDMLRDAGRSVQMLQQDAQTIETGLRLAQAKFGSKLALSGPQDFQEKAARIAAEAGLKVEFSDARLNRIMQDRRAELDAEKAREAEARQKAQEFAKQREDAKARPKVQPKPAGPQAAPERPAQDIEAKAPNVERGRYTGEVQAIDDKHVYQRHGPDMIRHDRANFDELPKPGDQVTVTYREGRASVKNRDQERGHDQGHSMGR